MKFLPLAMTQGPLLAEAVRGAARAAPGAGLCGWCGTALPAAGGRHGLTVRCPGCARRQQALAEEEAPWRLTPVTAEALRRTRTWLRRL